MKKLNKISLHNLSQAELAKREANLLKGGEHTCACASGGVCTCNNAGTGLDYYLNAITISTEMNDNSITSITLANKLAQNPGL